jgi:predicted nucleic acid-binding protein
VKVLFDANVLLDVLLEREPWFADSQAVWQAHDRQQIQGHIIATSLTNLFYVARKLKGRSVALQCVTKCLAAFEVLDVDAQILNDASMMPGIDFEDNVAIGCARTAQLDLIVTRDSVGFVHSPVPAVTPAELLTRLVQAEESSSPKQAE